MTKLIKCELLSLGWFVLNTDGCVKGSTKVAGASGLIRNDKGVWIRGFTVNLGSYGVDEVELWAVWHDLKVAWDLSIPNLEVQLDLSKWFIGYLVM